MEDIALRAEAFYSDPLARQLYLNTVARLLTRVNSITGVTYRYQMWIIFLSVCLTSLTLATTPS